MKRLFLKNCGRFFKEWNYPYFSKTEIYLDILLVLSPFELSLVQNSKSRTKDTALQINQLDVLCFGVIYQNNMQIIRKK